MYNYTYWTGRQTKVVIAFEIRYLSYLLIEIANTIKFKMRLTPVPFQLEYHSYQALTAEGQYILHQP
jgi:hypothetical protein